MKKIFVALFIILMMTTNPANATMTKEAHQLYQEACQLEYRNNYDAAISKIREAIDMTGEDAILYTKLAGLFYKKVKNENLIFYVALEIGRASCRERV